MVSKLIGAVYRIPLTNLLGAEGIGVYQLVFPIYALMLTLSSSAIPTAMSRLVSEKKALGDHIGGKKVLKSAGILLFGAGILTTLIMSLVSAPLAYLQGNSLVKYGYYAVTPAILFVACSSFFKGWFQGNMNMLPTAGAQIAEQVMKMAFGLTFAYFLRDRGMIYAVTGALIGLTLSEFLSLVGMAIIYLKERPKDMPTVRLDGRTTGEIVRVSVPIMLSSLIFPTVQFIDSLLIVNVLSARGVLHSTAVSEYGILTAPVNSLINMPIVITLAFAVAIVPIISSRRAIHDAVSIKDKSALALKLSVLFGLPCFVGILLLARPLMVALYPSFDGGSIDLATVLLSISAVSVVLLSVQQVCTSILQALGKSLASAKNLLITATIKIVLDVVLIYYLGIIGACVSSIIAYLFGVVLNRLSLYKLLGKNDKMFKNISKITLAGVIIGVIIYGLTYVVKGNWAIIGVSIAVCVPIYTLLILAMRVLTEEELLGFPFGSFLVKISRLFRGARIE